MIDKVGGWEYQVGRTDSAHQTKTGGTNEIGSRSGKAGRSDPTVGNDKSGLTIGKIG